MAIDNTVIVASRWLLESPGIHYTLQVTFDGGAPVATTYPIYNTFTQTYQYVTNNGQQVIKAKDVTPDAYSTTANSSNTPTTYMGGASSGVNTTRAILCLQLGHPSPNAPGPPPISGERQFTYELSDDPEQITNGGSGNPTVHTITVWVPGLDTILDRNGNLPTSHKQYRMPNWSFGWIEPYSVTLPGHSLILSVSAYKQSLTYANSGGNYSNSVEALDFYMKEISDPNNRFSGNTLFENHLIYNSTSIPTIPFGAGIDFGTVELKQNYVSAGLLNNPTSSDCVLANPSTLTSLRGIVSNHHYAPWNDAKVIASNNNTTVYDEFVTLMSVSNIHGGTYIPSNIAGDTNGNFTGNEALDVIPLLGGWAINSTQVSQTPVTTPGCMDTLAQNYSASNNADCNNYNASAPGPGGVWVSPGNTTCCWYCTDPTAVNYNSTAVLNCNGTSVGTTVGQWADCCQYNTPTTGCTDPTATNYNPAATIDDGSCISVVIPASTPSVNYAFTESCDNLGTADVTIDLAGATGLKNIITTTGGVTTPQSTCNPIPNIIIPNMLTPGGSIDIEGESSFQMLTQYDPNISSIAVGGTAPPVPSWALNTCGETITTTTTTSFSADTDVYVWYDTSSWGVQEVINAWIAIEAWLAVQVTTVGWTGKVHHIIAVNEKFADWAAYPMSGTCELSGGAPGGTCTAASSVTFNVLGNFARASAWILYNNIPNWYHQCNTQLKNPQSGNVSVYNDATGALLTNSILMPAATVSNSTCVDNLGVGAIGPSTYNGTSPDNGYGALPQAMPPGGNFLNIILLDECTSYSTGGTNIAYGNPPGEDGYTSSSTTNTSTHTSLKQQLQVKPFWETHYNNYVTLYNSWTGSARSFLYPTMPSYMTNQHYGSGQLMGAMVLSGNKTVPDGHFLDGTAVALHPIDHTTQSTKLSGQMDFFEDGTQGARHNVFWDKVNPVHPNFGYGGLDNYGWGVNVNMINGGLTQSQFNSDLTTFISSGPPITTVNTTATCDDSECILFIVKDDNGNLLSGYELKLDGISIGTTNLLGELQHTILIGSTLSSKTINSCWTLDPYGDCLQTKYELIVSKDTFTTNITCIGGCTDVAALNYNPLATWDDGSCLYCVFGCQDPNAINYSPLATCDDGTCIVEGCTNIWATNYNPAANVEDGSCAFPGDDNECVPDNIYYDIVNTKNCIAKFGTRYYKKVTTGMDDDCSTLLIWQLMLIDYLLPKFELNCFYNCADRGTPAASADNQGGTATDTTNYVDKFRTFVARHCEDCFTKPFTLGTDEIIGLPLPNIGKGGNDDGGARD